jgi:predicted transcriptional regulator
MRKTDVEVMEAMERGIRGGVVVDEDVLDRLIKLGMVEERKRGTYTLTARAKTYLLRRKSVLRGRKKKNPAAAGGAMSD